MIDNEPLISSTRNILVKQLETAEAERYAIRANLKTAELKVKEALRRLSSFDDAFGLSQRLGENTETWALRVSEGKPYRTGKTTRLVATIKTFGMAPFTPKELKHRYGELHPQDTTNFSTTADITRVLIKLMTSKSFPIERLEKGAGRKTPIYKEKQNTQQYTNPQEK